MPQNEDCEELRRQIFHLLRAQMQALKEPSQLSDVELAACYRRQEKVAELRDQLFSALNQAMPATDSTHLPSSPLASVGLEPATQAAGI
jgi:hypothetical protein